MFLPDELLEALASGQVIPYIGPGLLAMDAQCPLPGAPEDLAARMTAKVSVPFKIRTHLTAAAQFIENFKHRKTVTALMVEAFGVQAEPNVIHRCLASLPGLPLIVHVWYDDLLQYAFRGRSDWGVAQGVSQAEHSGEWVHYFAHDGTRASSAQADTWAHLLYEPLGALRPAANFLVSDSDLVEVFTEIDIQASIPRKVQVLRTGRHFLFLGCRFTTQVERIFARQIMKRSSGRHWAVLPFDMTRNEARFVAEQGILPLVMDLARFARAVTLCAAPPRAD